MVTRARAAGAARLIAAFWISICVAGHAVGEEASKPPLTFDALFQLEDITDAVFSPDGEQVAIVRVRARSSGNEQFLAGRMQPYKRKEIWLGGAESAQAPRRLTSGFKDGTSYWAPVWSPDGAKLLVLSDKGLDNVHLELIDARSGESRRISSRGIDVEAHVNGTDASSGQIEPEPAPMMWLDNERVLFVELAEGEVSAAIGGGVRRIDAMKERWEKTQKGREPSFSALDSRRTKSPRPPGRLVVLDLRTGSLTPLAEGVFRKVTVSPGGRFAAVVLEEGPLLPQADTLTTWQRRWFAYPPTTINFHTSLAIVSLEGTPKISRFPQVRDPVIDGIPLGSQGIYAPGLSHITTTYFGPAWLASKPVVALLGKQSDGDARRDTVFLVDADHGTVKVVAHPGIGAINLSVIGNDVFLRGGADAATFSSDERFKWYEATRDGGRFTAAVGKAARDAEYLVPFSSHEGALVDTDVGAFSVLRNGSVVQESSDPRLKGATLLWPNGYSLAARGHPLALLSLSDGRLVALRAARDGAVVEDIGRSPAGSVISFHGASATVAAIERSGTTGTTLLLKRPGADARALQSVNGFLTQFYDPPFVDIPYTKCDGHKTMGRLFLPPSYRKGQPLPVITYVYITLKPPEHVNLAGYEFYINMALAMQYGYGVFYPTINPREEYTWQGIPHESLKRDVVPAVMALNATGMADPQRVYVMGASYGGYSTFSLLTQTDVFAAGVSINGPSDLMTTYLDLDPGTRYTQWGFDNKQGVQGELDIVHPRMALLGSPWQQPDRYRANSPLWLADRVNTPLLLVQSDTDVFDMHQADNMYSALTRLGKEARYLRVWGEDHALDAPANIRLLWQEMTDWFQQHRRVDQGDHRASCTAPTVGAAGVS
ncbi:MAG: prolyl oligopeptidase family serine peptidase [Gammaproteobacteria bacterium]